MNLKRATSSGAAGSAMLVVLVLGTVLSITVGSYLIMARHQDASIVRSMCWNAGIPIAEAGIEEAMSQLHYTGVTNLSNNGWSLVGTVYVKQRTLGSNYFQVAITPVDPPVVTSTGYVALPRGLGSSAVYVQRAVQVNTRRDGLFVKAMVAKGQIDFAGNNIMTDSFDSADPNYSNNGVYDSSKDKTNGDVATDSGLINSLNVGNANVFGHVATGPNGSVEIGPNGSVGDKTWQNGGNTGIEPGWSSDDMNVAFPDIAIPYTSGWTPLSGTVNGQSYKYVLLTGNYILSDLTLKSSDVLYVAGNANLYVTGSISVSGKGQIEVGPGASLILYMGGTSASIGGNGVVNDTSVAANFVYLGLPTNTSLSYAGNASFTGAIYAPYANFSLGGGGNNTYDFVGASVSNTVTMNGHFHFHYDEALGRSIWGRGFIISSWKEL